MYSQGGVEPWQGKSWLIAGLALDLGLEQELQEFHSQGIADTVSLLQQNAENVYQSPISSYPLNFEEHVSNVSLNFCDSFEGTGRTQ